MKFKVTMVKNHEVMEIVNVVIDESSNSGSKKVNEEFPK